MLFSFFADTCIYSGGGGNVTGGVRGVWGGQAGAGGNSNAAAPPPPPQQQPADNGESVSGGGDGEGGGAGAGGGNRSGGFVGRTGGGDADGGYEGKLVEEICAAGGTKSTPGKVPCGGAVSGCTLLICVSSGTCR